MTVSQKHHDEVVRLLQAQIDRLVALLQQPRPQATPLAPSPPLLPEAVEEAIAIRAGGDVELQRHLELYARGALLQTDAEPADVAADIMEGDELPDI